MPVLRARSSLSCSAVVIALALAAFPASAGGPAIGDSCASGALAGVDTLGANNLICASNTWQYPAYQFGATSAGCDSTNAGMVQWTGSSVSPNNTFEFCNGSIWTAVNGAASSVPLSGLLAATTTNSIDNGSYAQTWMWNSLSSGNALTLSSNSATTGQVLDVADFQRGLDRLCRLF